MKTLIVMQDSPNGWNLEASYNIGTAAVSAYIKKMGHDVICLNLNRNRYMDNQSSADRVYNFIKTHNPDIVAVGCLVTDWEQVKEICDMARMTKPNIVVVIGGGFVTYSPEEAMSLIAVADYGVIGEGEVTLHELLATLENGASVNNIAGLIYRDSAFDFVVSQKRDVIRDLDTLPFLDYEGFGLFDEIRQTKSLAISSSRSCPFSCTYCTHSGGGMYRQRSLNRTFEEINYVLSHVPEVKTLTISDELFATDKDRFEQFIVRIAPYNFDWFLPMRADSFKDSDVFKKACDAGCTKIQVGLESGCDAILKSMRKGTSKAMLRELYKNANNSNISITSTVIFGDVEETMETVEESLAFVKELYEINPKVLINVTPIKLYPGSPLYSDAKDSIKIADTTKFIFDKIPLVNVSKMSDEEYNFLVKRVIPAMSTCHFVRTYVGRQKDWNFQRKIEDESFVKSYTYLRIANIDYNENTYYLSYTCPRCNANFYIATQELTYGLDFKDSSFCPSCQCEKHIKNKIYRAMLLDDSFFEIIKPILRRLLEKGNVGITGMGTFFARYRLEFKEIFDELESASENKFILSDGNPDIAYKSVAIGREIYSTERILHNINSIVVPSAFYTQIREMVNLKEPNVNVFGFFELPFLRESHINKSINSNT